MKAGIYGGKLFLPYLHAPGGRWSDGKRDYAQQVFSWHNGDTGQVLHFDIQQIMALMAAMVPPFDKLRLAEVTIEPVDAERVQHQHGIEEAGLARLSAERLDDPGIMVEYPDGRVTLIDGNHRFVRRYRLGMPAMRMWLLTSRSGGCACWTSRWILDVQSRWTEPRRND